MNGMGGFHGFRRDEEVLKHKVAPGTIRRILRLGRPYAGILAFFLLLVVLDASAGVVNPLIFRYVINRGILGHNVPLVIHFVCLAAVVALADAGFTFAQRYLAVKIGVDIVLDLRQQLFDHIQRMSLAFFTRARTGSLVSRLNTDVGGVRDAFTDILSSAIGNLITVALVLAVMFVLSWQLTLAALAIVPFFLFTARYVGKRIRKLTKEAYDRSADMNNLMVERFNVAGAMNAKIFGDPVRERELFGVQAGRVRDVSLSLSTYARFLFIGLMLMGSLAVCFVYGWGGVRAARGELDVGTVVALVSYLIRLYGPLTALSNLQVDYMTTLVSFERVFEVLDLAPMVPEAKPGRVIPAGPVRLEFSQVDFRYPMASEVSLASLEAVPALTNSKEKSVLHDISFTAEPGQCVALVGPSGAGKTTLAQLAMRFYDPIRGTVRMNGLDLREATSDSLRATVGMVTQDPHLFHDTVRANLLYARPGASEAELCAALEAAQILKLIQSLPQGLDTVLGDRGHRLSGGEKARVAIARILLKAPPFVILDEATAHLDSESERQIQLAFRTALQGRTSLVIAHRLSTVQHADLILVLEKGRVVERGRHAELVETGGLYAQLHRAFLAQPAGV